MSQSKINVIAIVGILVAVGITVAMIWLDSAYCAYRGSSPSFVCDVARGYVSIMAPPTLHIP
jgi:hypothetical protein